MSKGSPIVPLRIPAELLARIDEAIKSANHNRAEAEYNRTSWILHAISEKLAKRQRSNSPRKRPLPAGQGEQTP